MTTRLDKGSAHAGGARKLRAVRDLWIPVVALALALGTTGSEGADAFSIAALELEVEKGDVYAMTQLASRYELGEGVAKNYLRSNFLYCKAARLGHAEAQYKLAGIYANGRGVERNHDIAAGLYERAAAQGHEQSKRLQGFMKDHLQVRAKADLPVCTEPDAALPLRLSRDLPPVRTMVQPEKKGTR